MLDEVLEVHHGAEERAEREVARHLLLGDLAGMALDRRVGIEARRERLADLVEVEQCLADHGELRRQADAVLAGDLEQHQHRAAHLRPLQPDLLMLGEDVGDAALEGGLVRILAKLSQQQQGVRRVFSAVVGHREQ